MVKSHNFKNGWEFSAIAKDANPKIKGTGPYSSEILHI